MKHKTSDGLALLKVRYLFKYTRIENVGNAHIEENSCILVLLLLYA
jgi:hypothetical protein